MVGDVVGHGVAASAVDGSAARGRRRSDSRRRRPARRRCVRWTVRRAGPRGERSHVCVVVLDTATGQLEYCTAGHPPPLVVRPDDGRARFLPTPAPRRWRPPGEMTWPWTTSTAATSWSSTPTASWRARSHPADSTVELGQVAATRPTGPGADRVRADRVCEQALWALTTRPTGYGDDIAVLVAEVTEAAGAAAPGPAGRRGRRPAGPRRVGRHGWRPCGCATSTTSSCSTPSTSS